MRIVAHPWTKDAPLHFCLLPHPQGGSYWGYGLVSEYEGYDSPLVYMPFPFTEGLMERTEQVSTRWDARQIFVLHDKKPLHKYTTYLHHQKEPHTEVLENDCVVIAHPISMVETLEKLCTQYEYFYPLRYVSDSSVQEHIRANGAPPILTLFRACDVLPPDVLNSSGIVAQLHDGKYTYLTVVYSDTPFMFDVDGFCKKPSYLSAKNCIGSARAAVARYQSILALSLQQPEVFKKSTYQALLRGAKLYDVAVPAANKDKMTV